MERQISNKLPYLNTKWTSLKKKKINNERKNYERIVGLIGWLIMFEPNEKIANNFKVFVIQKLTKLFMVVKKKK